MRHFAKTSLALLFGAQFALVGAVGCTTVQSSPPAPIASAAADASAESSADYDSIESAAIAALSKARKGMTRQSSEKPHVGTILEVDGYYRWNEAASPSHAIQSAWRPTVRIGFVPNQVATYIIHPRTGERAVDRLNEGLTKSERSLVDQRDPEHRPLYVLTPSGRVLFYGYESEEIEVADLRKSRSLQRSQVSRKPVGASPTSTPQALAILASGAN